MKQAQPYTFDRVVRLAITTGLIFALGWLLQYLSDVLIPFAVALLLAYLMNPLVMLVQRWIHGRVPAVLISLTLVIAGLGLLVWLIIPPIVNEIGHTGRVLSNVVHSSDLAERAGKTLPPNLWQAFKEYAARPEVQDFFRTDNFLKLAEAVARKLLPGVWGLITGTTTFITGVVGVAVIGLYLVFLLLDYPKVRSGWAELLPPSHRDDILDFVRDFDVAMNRHFRAQAVVATIDGTLFAVGFSLIGLPLGILLGILAGALCMVPYLPILILPPALIMGLIQALDTGGSIWMNMGLVLIVFTAVQGLDGVFVTPRIMGEVTGLNPAMILLSLSIWGKLLGLFGLLIALPMTCLVLAYYRRFIIGGPSGALELPESPAPPPNPDPAPVPERKT